MMPDARIWATLARFAHYSADNDGWASQLWLDGGLALACYARGWMHART